MVSKQRSTPHRKLGYPETNRTQGHRDGWVGPIQRPVDKVIAIFVSLVLMVSGLTLLGWYVATGSFEIAAVHAVTVWVIACSGALGLAVPVYRLVGKGAAAQAGIMFQGSGIMEKAHTVTALVFNQSGCLMESCPQIAAILPNTSSEPELLQFAARILGNSDHPLAKAVALKTSENGIQNDQGKEVSVLLERGWQGRIGGQMILIGDRSLMREYGIDLQVLSMRSRECEIQGYTPYFIADQNAKTLLGILALSEKVKSTAFDAVQDLHALGIRTVMVSSENKASAFLSARALGVHEFHAQVQPEDQSRIIADLRARGETVAIVSERLDDYPALAQAQVAITTSTARQLIQGAGIVLLHDDPYLIVDALHISKRNFAMIRQLVTWAILYNALGIPLAALGLFSPTAAVGASALNSLLVLSTALHLGRWRLRDRSLPASDSQDM